MKKVKIDIPLELYTDNVRKIIERSLYDLDAEPPYIEIGRASCRERV